MGLLSLVHLRRQILLVFRLSDTFMHFSSKYLPILSFPLRRYVFGSVSLDSEMAISGLSALFPSAPRGQAHPPDVLRVGHVLALACAAARGRPRPVLCVDGIALFSDPGLCTDG